MTTCTRYVTDQGACIVGNVQEIRDATRALSCSIEVGPPSNKYRVSVPFYEARQGATFVPYAGYASSKWGTQCTNTRSREYEPFASAFLGTLRPEQERVVSKAQHRMTQRRPGAVIHCPTGGGKTVMALALAARLGLVPMVVAHKRVLVDQWKERIKTFYGEDTPIRRLQDSQTPDIVVETIQTAMRQDVPVPPHIGLLIIDECHHIAADVFKRILLRSTTKYVLGLTATPTRKDGLNIEVLIGPIISDHAASSGTIQNSGRVTVLRVPYWCTAYRNQPPISDRTGSIVYNAMVNTVVSDMARTERIVNLLMTNPMFQGRDVLVLSHRRSHVTSLVDMMKLRGMEADQFVPTSGKGARSCPPSKIVVSTYNYVAEGLDEPRFSVVVLGTSVIGAPMEQACGRVMRRMHDPSSHDPIIVDIADAWSVFRSHSSKRMVWYNTQKFTIKEHEHREPSNVSLFRTEL